MEKSRFGKSFNDVDIKKNWLIRSVNIFLKLYILDDVVLYIECSIFFLLLKWFLWIILF